MDFIGSLQVFLFFSLLYNYFWRWPAQPLMLRNTSDQFQSKKNSLDLCMIDLQWRFLLRKLMIIYRKRKVYNGVR